MVFFMPEETAATLTTLLKPAGLVLRCAAGRRHAVKTNADLSQRYSDANRRDWSPPSRPTIQDFKEWSPKRIIGPILEAAAAP